MSRAGWAALGAVCWAIALGCTRANPAAPEPEPEPARVTEPAPLAVPTPAPSAAPGPKLAELCPDMCKRSSALACAQAAQCEVLCAAQLEEIPCPERMHAFMSCALREQTEHWECGELGVASLRDGYCDAEQAAFAQCLAALQGV